MSDKNPYAEALDPARHAESQNPFDNPVDDDGGRVPLFDSPEHTVTETDVRHLKQPGGTLACGTSPHGVEATLSSEQVTCKACEATL